MSEEVRTRGGRRERRLAIFDGAIRTLAAKGKNARQIAEFVGVTRGAVADYCRWNRIDCKTTQHGPRGKLKSERDEQIIALYLENRTLDEVGRRFGITRERVRQIVKDAGMTPRSTLTSVKTLRPRKKRLTSIERFWLKVNKEPGQGPKGECWEWMRGRHQVSGYGRTRFMGRGWWVHQVAFFLANKKRATKHVLHSCDNPPCCNPEHLRDGTPQENVADRDKRNRTSPEKRRFRFQRHQVVEIKKLIAAGVPQVEIYKMFGSSYNAINAINTGRTWSRVQIGESASAATFFS